MGLNYFFDSATGLLFVKLQSNKTRIADNYCPPGGCEGILIRASGSSLGTNSGFCSSAYPKYSIQEVVPSNPGE